MLPRLLLWLRLLLGRRMLLQWVNATLLSLLPQMHRHPAELPFCQPVRPASLRGC